MVSALNDHVIDGQDSFWHDDATWRGPVGAGVKPSLQAFKDGWQKPFLTRCCGHVGRKCETTL